MGRKTTDGSNGVGERDAIQRVNGHKRKGFIKGNDAKTKEENSGIPATPPAEIPSQISGNDSGSSPESSSEAAPEAGSTISQEDLPDGQFIYKKSEIDAVISAGIRAGQQGYERKLADAEQKLQDAEDRRNKELKDAQEEKERLEKKLAAEQKGRESLARTFTDFGFALPGTEDTNTSSFIAPQSTRGGISARDALREYKSRLDGALKESRSVMGRSGQQFAQKDNTLLDQFLKANRQALRSAMDSVARDAGIFQGRYGAYNKDAPTTFENFPVVIREYLSQVVRLEHAASFVLWQFANRNIRVGVPPNQTTDIPRVKHITTGTTSSDWRLTPGVPIDTTQQQSLQGDNISLRIHEYGMGNTVKPVALADIVTQTNILDLERLLQDRISYNYHTFEEVKNLELLLSSTRVVYPANGGIVEDPAGVTPGSGGQLSLSFLGHLRALMSNVPPLDNGCLIFVGNPYHISQIEDDIEGRTRYVDKTSIEDLENMLARKTRNDYSGRISGYKGKFRGFEVFEDTFLSNGIVGTPGVQLETLGGVPTITRASFAMGADAIGWGTSLPMELRTEMQNYERIKSIIWKSHEEATGLDIDPNRILLPWEIERPPGAEEQLRVFQIRSSMSLV